MLFINSKTDSKKVKKINCSSNSGSNSHSNSSSSSSSSSNSRTKCNNLKFLTSDLSLFLEQTPLEIVNDYQIVDENLDITLNIYRSNKVINNEVINDKELSKGLPLKVNRNFKNGLLNSSYSSRSVHYYSIYTESIQKVILNTSKGNNLIFIYLQEVIEKEENEIQSEIQREVERRDIKVKTSRGPNVPKDLFKWDRKEIERISRLY